MSYSLFLKVIFPFFEGYFPFFEGPPDNLVEALCNIGFKNDFFGLSYSLYPADPILNIDFGQIKNGKPDRRKKY
jgi:hypothetical protein